MCIQLCLSSVCLSTLILRPTGSAGIEVWRHMLDAVHVRGGRWPEYKEDAARRDFVRTELQSLCSTSLSLVLAYEIERSHLETIGIAVSAFIIRVCL